MLQIFRHAYHAFYHIIFDDERKVYRVLPAGKYRLPMHIQLRFYGVSLLLSVALVLAFLLYIT